MNVVYFNKVNNIFADALKKITNILGDEQIDYMIVGGFAMSYYNRARTTNDIDLVLQIYPSHIPQILQHFDGWEGFEEIFKKQVELGQLFNITDYENGIRYDFITFKNDDYSWTAFERKLKVIFFGVECYIITIEDLIISKLIWYNLSKSEKQLDDLKFLLLSDGLNLEYLNWWIFKKKIDTHGLLG